MTAATLVAVLLHGACVIDSFETDAPQSPVRAVSFDLATSSERFVTAPLDADDAFAIPRFVIACGGRRSAGGIYAIDGTIAQWDPGEASGPGYVLRGGFWSGAGTVLPIDPIPTDACPGDLDGNGTVDGADLGTLLAEWGACFGPCPSDIDRDGQVDGSDLGILLGHWGGCPDD